jgi:hypothetical protein
MNSGIQDDPTATAYFLPARLELRLDQADNPAAGRKQGGNRWQHQTQRNK